MTFDDLVGLLIGATFLSMLVVELRWPARRFAVVRGWTLIGLGFFVLIMAINALVPMVIPIDWVRQHALFYGTSLGVGGGTVVGLVVLTFVDYWVHRAEHRFDVLWRTVHQLHHSQDRVDIAGSVYFHPLDMIVLILETVLVNVLILGLDPRAAALATFCQAVLGMFQHWNVRTPYWLGYLVQRPEAHYRHHEREVHAMNYANLPVWDMLFGTYHNPRQVPDDYTGRVGFEGDRGRRIGSMLLGRDVNADVATFEHFK